MFVMFMFGMTFAKVSVDVGYDGTVMMAGMEDTVSDESSEAEDSRRVVEGITEKNLYFLLTDPSEKYPGSGSGITFQKMPENAPKYDKCLNRKLLLLDACKRDCQDLFKLDPNAVRTLQGASGNSGAAAAFKQLDFRKLTYDCQGVQITRVFVGFEGIPTSVARMLSSKGMQKGQQVDMIIERLVEYLFDKQAEGAWNSHQRKNYGYLKQELKKAETATAKSLTNDYCAGVLAAFEALTKKGYGSQVVSTKTKTIADHKTKIEPFLNQQKEEIAKECQKR